MSDYRRDYRDFERDAYWTLPRVLAFVFVAFLGTTVLGIGACAVGLIGGAADNAAQVVKKEFYPDALLRKYEWFKDASAALDAKVATIEGYNNRIKELDAAYVGVLRRDWPRDDREQRSIWRSELTGIRASYNGLAAEYNSQMSKFNYRFTNVGDLPPGASNPLPREYKPYIEE